MGKTKDCLSDYLKLTVPLAFIIYLLRIYEYFTAGIKLASSSNILLVIIRWFYFDTCTWLIYIALLFIPFLLFYLIRRKAGQYFLLLINGLTIIGFFSLLIVFSERLVPFDHELFVRNGSESITIVKNVVTGRFWIISPVFLYVTAYYVLYLTVFQKEIFHHTYFGNFCFIGYFLHSKELYTTFLKKLSSVSGILSGNQ